MWAPQPPSANPHQTLSRKIQSLVVSYMRSVHLFAFSFLRTRGGGLCGTAEHRR